MYGPFKFAIPSFKCTYFGQRGTKLEFGLKMSESESIAPPVGMRQESDVICVIQRQRRRTLTFLFQAKQGLTYRAKRRITGIQTIFAGPYFMGDPEGLVGYCRASHTLELYALRAANPWPA
jgi:hypothetical protein